MQRTPTTTWSPQQTDFLNWAWTGTGSCVLQAVAGAGKTTVILAAVEKMSGNSAILAYNTKISDEIKTKLKKRNIDFKKCEAGTVHSFGFRAYRRAFPEVKVVPSKVFDILNEDIAATKIDAALVPHAGKICNLVSLAKQRAIGITCPIESTAAWQDIIDHFNILDDKELVKFNDTVIALAKDLLIRSNKQRDIIDFDDMVYAPVFRKVRFWTYANVFIDEAQDTNPARRELVKCLVSRGGRVVLVGDKFQAIYAFSGADSESLEISKREFNCIEMPLTVTYRCPKLIVEFARKWVGHITAADTAPEGKLEFTTFDKVMQRKDLNSNSAMLCRNTKPLVNAAFTFLRNRIPCRIEGREIGEGLKKLVTRWKRVKTLSELDTRLGEFRDDQAAKFKEKKQESKIEELDDRIETIRVIMENCLEKNKTLVSDLVSEIDNLFADNVSGVLTLSTIHKSKGREWNTVFWLDRAGTLPSRYAKQPWEIQAENNLCYVAATRAMDTLVEVSPPAPRKTAATPSKENDVGKN